MRTNEPFIPFELKCAFVGVAALLGTEVVLPKILSGLCTIGNVAHGAPGSCEYGGLLSGGLTKGLSRARPGGDLAIPTLR